MNYRSEIIFLMIACILLNLIFTSGCVHTIRETDIFVTKLHGDGTPEWVRVIDSGKNDVATDLIETSEKDYVISGGGYSADCGYFGDYYHGRLPMSTPRLIRLSSEGNIIWSRDYPSVNPSPGSYEGFITVLQKPDGGFESVSEFGEIVIMNKDGNLAGNFSRVESYTVPQRWTDARKIDDGGYILNGIMPVDKTKYVPYFARIDKNGSWMWKEYYPVTVYDARPSVREDDGNTGSPAGNGSQEKDTKEWAVSIVTLDSKGAFFNTEGITFSDDSPRVYPVMRSGRESPFIFVSAYPDHTAGYPRYEGTDPGARSPGNAVNPSGPPVYFNSSGNEINQSIIRNIRGRIFLESSDGGFISVYPEKNRIPEDFEITRSDADGNIRWTRSLPPDVNQLFSPYLEDTILIKQVIPTSDGDYIIWGNREKISRCFYISMT